MKLLFKIRITPYQTIKRFLLPNMNSSHVCGFIDAVCSRRLDAMKDFSQRPKNRFSLLVLFLDLRLKQQMNVVGHDRRSKQLILTMIMRVENTFQNDIALGRGELTFLSRGKGHHVFRPGAFKMWEPSL